MDIAKKDDAVLGYQIDEQIYCPECFNRLDPERKLIANSLIFEPEQGEDYYLCDQCGELF
jgi:DNA-directed RNA polymerase subunit RPC12/RpoP